MMHTLDSRILSAVIPLNIPLANSSRPIKADTSARLLGDMRIGSDLCEPLSKREELHAASILIVVA